jgi:hypothetical protein
VIATRDFAEFYFDNDTGLPLTLCSRLTGLHAQPVGAGKPSAIYAGSEAVTRGCGTLGGDYSAALASGFAGFHDWAHAAPAQSIFRLHAARRANATMVVRHTRPIRCRHRSKKCRQAISRIIGPARH